MNDCTAYPWSVIGIEACEGIGFVPTRLLIWHRIDLGQRDIPKQTDALNALRCR